MREAPKAIDIERQVLGALLASPDELMPLISRELGEGSFYVPSHAKIYRHLVEMFQRGMPIDLTTLGEELRRKGCLEQVGGELYLVELTMKVAPNANALYHAKILRGYELRRRLIALGSTISQRAYSPAEDEFGLLDEMAAAVNEMRSEIMRKKAKTFAEVSVETSDFLEAVHNGSPRVGLIDFGFKDLDQVVAGMMRGNLAVLAATRKGGKSTFALQSVLWNARKGIPCLIESGEMTRIEIQCRLACIDERIRWDKVKRRELSSLEWGRLFRRVASYAELPIYIRDGRISEEEISADIQTHVRKGVRYVVLDYLQQINTAKVHKDDHGEERLANLSYRIKDMATDNQVQILALSSVNKELVTRGSVGIEYAADLIIKFDNKKPEDTRDGVTSYFVDFEVVQRFGLSGVMGDGVVRLRYNLTDGAWYNSDDVFTPQQGVIAF